MWLHLRRRTSPGTALSRSDGGPAVAAYAVVVGVAALGAVGLLGLVVRQPLLFPSLGPTVMVLAERPRSASAHPRNVLLGHAVGVAAGFLALVVCRVPTAQSVLATGLTPARIGAAVLSVALTTFVLQVLRAPHAPAGATTLIVSLGLLTTPLDLGLILVSVALVTAVATALNLLTGTRRRVSGGASPTSVRSARDEPPGNSAL